MSQISCEDNVESQCFWEVRQWKNVCMELFGNSKAKKMGKMCPMQFLTRKQQQ